MKAIILKHLPSVSTMLTVALLLIPLCLSADIIGDLTEPIVSPHSYSCGAVNYTQGAAALHAAHGWIVGIMLAVVLLLNAIAAVLSVISALQIYFKMNDGDPSFKKDILMLVGGVLFMIGSAYVFPAFFGYSRTGSDWRTIYFPN